MQNPYARYKEQSVMTMTQGDMINLLFDEVINRLNKGLVSLEQNDYEGSNAHFKKAQAIVTHLSSTLDHQYEVAGGLASLYEYFNYQILQEEVLPMIAELKEAFSQADKQVRMGHTG